MRVKPCAGLLLVLVSAALLGGCNNKLKSENDLLAQENESLRGQLNDRNMALESANQELREKSMQLSEARERGPGTSDGLSGFQGIDGVTGSVGAGEVTASVEGDFLFDSGRATLKTTAKRSLDSVAGVLNSSYAGQSIRIEGHTDADPIKKSGHKSNYHLGFERAYAVREYLISKGVSPNRIYLASFGPDQPKTNKQQSRRVEITVLLQ
jgi:chemotaxis protein MotB